MSAHATARSKVLGIYIQFKGIEWALMGLVAVPVCRGGARSLGRDRTCGFLPTTCWSSPRLGILIWVVGVLVRYRRPPRVVLRRGLPSSRRFWARCWEEWPRFPWRPGSGSPAGATEYLTGIKVFGILAAVVFAMDMAALLASSSPPAGGTAGASGRPATRGEETEPALSISKPLNVLDTTGHDSAPAEPLGLVHGAVGGPQGIFQRRPGALRQRCPR